MSLALLFPVPQITLFARFSPYFVLPVTVILGVSGATKAAELSIRPLVAFRSVTRPWSSDREDVNGRNETAINLVSAKVNMGNHLSCDWPRYFNTR